MECDWTTWEHRQQGVLPPGENYCLCYTYNRNGSVRHIAGYILVSSLISPPPHLIQCCRQSQPHSSVHFTAQMLNGRHEHDITRCNTNSPQVCSKTGDAARHLNALFIHAPHAADRREHTQLRAAPGYTLQSRVSSLHVLRRGAPSRTSPSTHHTAPLPSLSGEAPGYGHRYGPLQQVAASTDGAGLPACLLYGSELCKHLYRPWDNSLIIIMCLTSLTHTSCSSKKHVSTQFQHFKHHCQLLTIISSYQRSHCFPQSDQLQSENCTTEVLHKKCENFLKEFISPQNSVSQTVFCFVACAKHTIYMSLSKVFSLPLNDI